MNGSESSALRRAHLRGLAWGDWRRHRLGMLVGMPAIAFGLAVSGGVAEGSWVLFLYMALAMALGCGFGYGRSEWSSGEEEFSLSLPPTRRDRYLVRLAIGILTMLVVYAIGWVCLFTGLPAWVLERTGLPPFGEEELPGFLMQGGASLTALALGAPMAFFVSSFCLSMESRHRGDPRWVLELPLLALATLGLFWLDASLVGTTGAFGGWLLGAFLLAFTLLRARIGLRLYERKHAAVDVLPAISDVQRTRLVLVGLVLLTGFLLLGTLVFWIRSGGS